MFRGENWFKQGGAFFKGVRHSAISATKIGGRAAGGPSGGDRQRRETPNIEVDYKNIVSVTLW